MISRVQTQNLHHAVYQRLRKDLDVEIAEAVREQVMPGLGSALTSVIEHMTTELKTNIEQMVRASVEHAVQAQLAPLRKALEAKPGAAKRRRL